MKKRLLSLLLSLALLLSFAPTALASNANNTRETNFFTDQEHTDTNFADIEYVHIDTEPILEEIAAIRTLLTDKANADKALEQFTAVVDKVVELVTMDTLAYIHHSQNVMDEKAAEELAYCEAACTEAADAINQLARDALQSPCGEIFKQDMTEDDIEYYLSYSDMTSEQKELLQKELSLETKYNQAAANITVEYESKEWTDDSAYFAMTAGELDAEAYDAIAQAYAEKQNEVLGNIYLEMIPIRNQIAKASGYDSYPEYAYETTYQRDYSPEDIQAFHKAVKDGGFCQISNELLDLARASLDEDIYYGDYTSDETIALVEGYMGQMSSELAEAYAYMRQHGLYDVKAGEYKDGSGYTTILSSYGAPFFFNTPLGYFGDFTTIVHEFGHYNESYWVGADLESAAKSQDLSEVHSQGLELLFTHWYDDIFEDSAQFCRDFLMANLTQVISDGALHDELQQYVYSTENPTLEQINRKYRQLCGEYGVIDADDPREQMFGWTQIPHTFTSPCYYISYAVSAAGAFAFWLEAQQGEYFDAVDNYLRFCALPGELGFQESFAEMKMENPLTPEYLAELAKTLRTTLQLDERTAALQPTAPADMTGSEWFAEAVMALYAAGVIETDGSNMLRPREQALWSDAAALVERLTKELPETKNGDAAITRLEFARLLVEELELEPADTAPFTDTNDGAVGTLAEMEAITGYADGTFRPNQNMSRAEMWVVAYRVLMSLVDGLVAGVSA